MNTMAAGNKLSGPLALNATKIPSIPAEAVQVQSESKQMFLLEIY